MATARRIPMPRSRGGGGSGSRRAAAHPGVAGSGAKGPAFVSPFQPPPSAPDLIADVARLDPLSWQCVMAGGVAWRVRIAPAYALADLTEAMTGKGRERQAAEHRFIQSYMHPDDFDTLLMRMADPDDEQVGMDTFEAVVRAMTTNGTARPFLR